MQEIRHAEETPAVAIDYAEETLTNFIRGGVYVINGEEYVMADKTTLPILPKWMGGAVSIVKKGSGAAINSEPQTLEVPGRPKALSGLRGQWKNNGADAKWHISDITGRDVCMDRQNGKC